MRHNHPSVPLVASDPMIIPKYHIAASATPGVGKGLFVDEPVGRGRVIMAPDNVHTVWPQSRLLGYPRDSIEALSSVRWFEDRYSLTPEWSDECYINHSFAPTALWHLGFAFALMDLESGTEITVDYRLVVGDGEAMPFQDALTGRPIVGFAWAESLGRSAMALRTLFPFSVSP